MRWQSGSIESLNPRRCRHLVSWLDIHNARAPGEPALRPDLPSQNPYHHPFLGGDQKFSVTVQPSYVQCNLIGSITVKASFSLAKAWQGKLLRKNIPYPKKAPVDRKILDLCQHLQKLDVRWKYGPDLDEFKKHIGKKLFGPATEADTAGGNRQKNRTAEWWI